MMPPGGSSRSPHRTHECGHPASGRRREGKDTLRSGGEEVSPQLNTFPVPGALVPVTTDATDAELVEGVRQGSRDAAEQLAQRYLRSCRAIALAIIGDLPGAEDASQ